MAQLIHGTTINGHIAIHAGNLADHSLATTSYVTTQINNLIAGAPGALNTLDELAAALGDDASFASTLTNSLAGKLSLSGGTMTGQLYIPSAGTGVYEGALQIREQGYVGSNQSDWSYAPAITFHWGNRHVQRFGVRADGLFAVDNEPFALRSWVTSQSYLTALPSHNHDDRYYTESESDSRFAAISHSHTFASLTSKPTTISGYGITDAITTGNIGSQSVNYATSAGSAGSVAWTNVSSRPTALSQFTNDLGNYGGFLTSLPSHNHDDRYYTETESDGRYLYYRGMNQETDFQRFVNTPGVIRFDQANATGGFSNAPGGYQYGGVLSMRGVNFGFQLWGSHTGDFYYKTQWQDDQYSGWREVITSANIGSQSVSYASQVGINYNNNSNSTYQLLWGSGNSVYGTSGVYLNPASDYVYASSFVASDWLRTTGNTGWYSETYGGGWYMTDSSYLRPYNGKSISMGNASVDYVNQLHFNDNVRFYQDGNNQYLNFKWGNSGAGGIIFMDGDGSRQGYLYASGTGSIGILDSGGNWKVRVDTSDVEMYGTQYLTDVYANIIYDRNNSAYYVNPASTSRINSTIIYGGTSGTSPRLTFMTTDDNDTNKYIGMVSYWTQIGCHVNEGLRLVNSNGTEQFYVRGGTSGNEAWFRGNLIGATSVSSPIFYDSDNSAWYGNFSGSSRLYLLGLGGATPDAALSVSGTAHVDGTLYLGGTAGTVNSWGTRTTGGSGYWRTAARDVAFNNEGYGSSWTFFINSAGAVTLNRHIDANTTWGSASGNTIFVGWYGGKIILGNNSDSGHDYASAITAQSIVSTNRHYFYKGASLNNTVQGAEVFTVDGVNGRLFTVTDDLSDSLFSVNTIAGLPVIEAFADNIVKIGPYSAPVTFSASGISTTSHGTSANWLTAYNKRPTGVSFSGSSTKTLTVTLGDGSTLTAAFNDIDTDTDTNTDSQTLSLSGNTLSISGGNSVTLSSSGLSQATADTLYVRKNTWDGNLYLHTDGRIYGTIFYDANDSAYYLDPNSRSNINTLTANGKEHYFGTSGGWDGAGFGNLTNVHMQGHSQFWFGAGNAYWWNGGINSEHDLLITTMYGYDTKSYYRGITFAVDNNGNGSSGGYRLGRWQTYGTGWNTARLQVDASLSVGYGNRIHGGSYNEGAYPLDRGVWTHGRDTAGYGDDRVRSKLFSPTANGGGPWGSFASLEVSSILDGNSDIPALFRMHQWGSGAVEFWKPQGTTLYIRESPGGGGSWFTRLEVQGSHYVTSSQQAYSYQGHSNVSGTGNASYHPSGIYSTGTNWMYGTMYLNNNIIYDINIAYASGSFRAPIFYDSENTAFYVDPSGSSRIRNLYVGDSGSNWSDPGGWGTQVWFSNGPHTRFIVEARTPGIQAGIYVHTPDQVYIGSYTGHNVNIMRSGSRKLLIEDGRIYSDVYMEAAGSMRAPIFYDSNNTGYYVDPDGSSRMATINADYIRSYGNARVDNNLYLDQQYGSSIIGAYASTRYQGVFAMGDSYKLAIDGSGVSNLYGMTWSHPNAGGVAGNLNTHGLLVLENGTFLAAISGSIRARDDMRAPIFYDSQNTAYYVDPNNTSELYKFSEGTLDRNDGNSRHVNSPYLTRAAQDYRHRNGTMGWGSYDLNVIASNWGSGFFDTWSSPANGPGASSHYVGVQAMHYSNSDSARFHGWQMVCSQEANNRWFWRSAWDSPRSWVEMIHSGNIGSQTVSNSDMVDGYHASTSTIANGIVVRDGNGYIFGNYINTTDDVVGGSVSGVIVKQGDNYHRTGNQAAIRSFLGLGSLAYSSATIPTNNNQLTNGAGYITSPGNITRLWAASHPSDYYIVNNWTGTYWQLTTNHGSGVQVAYANDAGYASSSGNSSNTSSISNAVGGSYTWTAENYFRSNRNTDSSSPPLQAYSSGGGGAIMAFHRGGYYAVNFGLDSDNVIRIGGWSAGANRLQLDMSGNLTLAGDVTAFSDARVKTNVQTIENALDKTLALRGVSYNRTDSDDTRTKIGVIAQETLEVVPEVVNQDNSGMYNVSYGNMTALLIEAIKEQQAQIEDLKAEVKKLRGE